MDLPEDVETMQSFLGLVNYLNRFSPRLAELSEPLREVCRQDTEFQLTKSVRGAFSKMKRGNFQECHSSVLQPSEWHYTTNRCIQEGAWCSYTSGL